MTALHAAAAHGPLALVERLIREGALEWECDAHGRTALEAAEQGDAPEREAILELLDRPVIRDPAFRAAVAALHAGDVATLEGLLDAEPRLLHERCLEPDCYREAGREQYFLDPKLVWFVAGNPGPGGPLPDSIVEVARVLLARGVEPADRDYTLELVMTSEAAREEGHQLALMDALLQAGATATPRAVEMALGHGELEPVQALLRAGHTLTAPIAAALGETDELTRLLADGGDVQAAFGFAVINGRVEAARIALDAGADVDAVLPVHDHSVALHHAASEDDVETLELLLARGARTDVRDTLWNGTPLGWAEHAGHARAAGVLRR